MMRAKSSSHLDNFQRQPNQADALPYYSEDSSANEWRCNLYMESIALWYSGTAKRQPP